MTTFDALRLGVVRPPEQSLRMCDEPNRRQRVTPFLGEDVTDVTGTDRGRNGEGIKPSTPAL
jgi:hypothetical protein